MKSTISAVLLLTTVAASAAYTIKQFKCECSEKAIEEYVYPNFTCSSSPGKTSSLANSEFFFRKPINEIWISSALENKIRNKFQDMMKIKPVEFCKEVASIESSSNAVFLMMYKTAKDAAPKLVHACPYTDIRAHNIAIDTKHLPKMMLQGEYRSKTMLAASKNGESLCNITMVISF